ncbi:MAG: hypothetical protein HQM10_09990 [Candidatus Riflebacteria bacterium]|nr:hypothetical protein [Candidatus Riflebacteria bacterium]
MFLKVEKIIVVDPGRSKCGYAVMNMNADILDKGIAETSGLVIVLGDLICRNNIRDIVLGKGTFYSAVDQMIKTNFKEVLIHYEEEKNTTFEARKRYFECNPPQGIWKYIPLGLQAPPVPIDDYAAVIIGERFIFGHNK